MSSGPTYPHSSHDFGYFWIENEILFLRFKEDVYLDLPTAISITQARLQFQEAKEYPIFCDINGLCGSTSPARNYLALQSSYLIKSVVFYTQTKKPARLTLFLEQEKVRIKIPYLITNNKSEGIKYLKSDLKKRK